MTDRFRYLTSEGALLPSSFLERLAANDPSLSGLEPADYHLAEGERLTEAIASAWNRLLPAWRSFQAQREAAGAKETLTGPTRERWLLPLFSALGFGRLATAKPREIEGKSYAVSHAWSEVPIHLVGAGVDLDRRTAGVVGAAKASPHSLVQEVLNRSENALWGLVSNGMKLRLLRDSAALSRQAYLEFDLEGIFAEEAFGEFTLLYLLVHPSRFEGERPEQSFLERWAREAAEQGTRALDSLRDGVQNAITALGKGFIELPANGALRDALRDGDFAKQDFYRELLREVYRLIFLFVAEDRGLLHAPGASEVGRERYARFFSTTHLRRLSTRRSGTRHVDLWQAYRQVVAALSSEKGLPELALPALGGFLFSPASTPWLDRSSLANRDLLEAVRALSTTKAEGGRLGLVDWRNLGSEELGSVYEALLELHPEVNLEAFSFELSSAAGHERKTTGSYYTPSSLIQCLLDSALDPVIAEAAKSLEPERALLALKICDPACGSGHFLIAAAHRLAKRVAAVRSGEDEPSPEAVRTALRDVIGRCLYGVDLNPMAVELCKVNLWLESLEPGRPLSFLDHHIQCGNSLLGATPALLDKGIPDDVFTAIEGDDKELIRRFKGYNKRDRKEVEAGQHRLDTGPWMKIGRLSTAIAVLDGLPDTTVGDVREKERRYSELVSSADYDAGRFLADSWCAAFVWRKVEEPGHPLPITEGVFRDIERNPQLESARRVRAEVRRLANRHQFLHWHLAFPDVFRVPGEAGVVTNEHAGWSGGFSCVLGNPPWEQTQVLEKEFFADRAPHIAEASGAARKALIDGLKASDPELFREFIEARAGTSRADHLIASSNLLPLSAVGRLNSYALFSERNLQLIAGRGRVGCIVPSGIATDDSTKLFFQHIVESRALVSLFEFENEGFFQGAGQGHMNRFCLLTITGEEEGVHEAQFLFQGKDLADLHDPLRRFTLTGDEIRLLNPNTRTCPIFRWRRDAEITKSAYRRVATFVDESMGDLGNPWQVSFRQGLFNMTSDSNLFRTREDLERDGFLLSANIFARGLETYLPLYEAKMMNHFDHRFGDYALVVKGQRVHVLPSVSEEAHCDPNYASLPFYWVPSAEVDARLRGRWDREWLLGWRDVTDARASARTVIAAVIPKAGVGNQLPLIFAGYPQFSHLLCGVLSAFVFDFLARQKVGGNHLNFFILKQLPVVGPDIYSRACAWDGSTEVGRWLASRIVELVCTTHEMAEFGLDCGYHGPPFRWSPERRFEIRSELDAAYLHLYGIESADAEYILDSFEVVRRSEERLFGDFRTKRRILKIYDQIQQAIDSGEPFISELEPPPGDPRAAHPGREPEGSGNSV